MRQCQGKEFERIVREGDERVKAQELSWSSGGKKLVFASLERMPSKLFLMDGRGRGLRALTDPRIHGDKPNC